MTYEYLNLLFQLSHCLLSFTNTKCLNLGFQR